MKIALAHDSLTQYGGAERVLQALHDLYPDAPVFTLVYDKRLAEHFEDWQIVSSPLQYLYKFLPRLQYFLPLIPWAMRRFDFSGFDLVISSSSVFMKNIDVPAPGIHINYCHTPARFLWMSMDSYVAEELPKILRPFSWLMKMFLRRMRKWDYAGAQRVNFFVANSENTHKRITAYYGRESEIVCPYVDTEIFYPSKPKEDFYLLAGRLQKHKRADIVVQAFNKLGLPLHVVGTGRAEAGLRAIAKNNIHFLGAVPNEILRDEYSAARALIFPQEEDFGIVPLESFACGTPVIAYGKGGALETVTPQTGMFFEQQTPEAVVSAVQAFDASKYFSEDLFDRAQQFSKDRFQREIAALVERHIA